MENICGMVYRIYPTKAQEEQIKKTVDGCRFVYNYFLALKTKMYQEEWKKLSFYDMAKLVPPLKEEYPLLTEVESTALIFELKNLDRAFEGFFKKRSGYPKFRSRHADSWSFQMQNMKNRIRIEGSCIRLPKVGLVKIKLHRPVVGVIANATVRGTADGEYYVSLCVRQEIEAKENAGGEVGVSITGEPFCAMSDGTLVERPEHWDEDLIRLAREQKKLSRKSRDSKNREKQKKKVAKLYRKIANRRKDFLHKQALSLARENRLICMEKLPLKELMEGEGSARTLSDAAYGEFGQMVAYKTALHGGTLIRVPAEELDAGAPEFGAERAEQILEIGLAAAKAEESERKK